MNIHSFLYMDSLRTIVTEVCKAINGMSPECLQDFFVIKANVYDLRDNNKRKVYKFKTMTCGKHKIKNWQCPICQCGECLIYIFKVS